MAIDFLIFGLILISLFINLLALGAFWVTPGLRTMANRFVINLLIINIVGCIILTPPLFITQHQNQQQHEHEQNSNSLNKILNNGHLSIYIKNSNNHNSNNNEDNNNINSEYIRNNNNDNDNLIEEDGIDIVNGTIITSKTLMKCNNEKCEKIMMRNDDDSETIVITEMELNNNNIKSTTTTSEYHNFIDSNTNSIKSIKRQRWFIDLAAALGALSVLLVVGDTWCAVTDPLRYHTRISAVKSWILIACTWSLGILFGLMSALLENVFTINHNNNGTTTATDIISNVITATNLPLNDFQSESYTFDDYQDSNILQYRRHHQQQHNLIDDDKFDYHNLYSMIYACIYFIVIILLPFGFVCGMYWRIFSEARKNGLRMRQNGSSPLLQSALNLSNTLQHQQQHQQQQQQHQQQSGLIMKIDRKNSNDQDVLNPLLPPPSLLNDNNNKSQQDNESFNNLSMAKQNIFLTLSKTNDEIKRNLSAHQLRLLETSSQDLNETQMKSGIRHAQSTPNLMKKNQIIINGNNVKIDNNYSSPSLHHMNMNLNSNSHHHHHHHHVLQIPPLNVSPKSLSYMTSIRHRLSNASSLFKYREESRAARISILVVIMFLVSYLPYGVLLLLQQRLNTSFTNSIQIAIIMILMGNLSSPFIFAYRNKRVCRGVKRLFHLDKQSKELHLNNNQLSFLKSKNHKINVHRNTSKVSNYSTNSSTTATTNKFLTPFNGIHNGTFLHDIEKFQNHNKKDLIERIHLPNHHDHRHSAIQEKKSFLKLFCDSSRKLGCATNSCANSDNEQVDV